MIWNSEQLLAGQFVKLEDLVIFLDTLIKPNLKHIKSYIQDSVDFLNKCPREVDLDTEIICDYCDSNGHSLRTYLSRNSSLFHH